MGGKNKSPDYAGAAVAQGEANRETVRDQTYANRPDQYTPWGSTTWVPEDVDGTERWTQTQSLSPTAQAELDKQMALLSGKSDVAGSLIGRMGNEFGQAMDWSGLGPLGQVPEGQFTRANDVQTQLGDPTAMRERAESAVYDKGSKRLDAQYAGQRQAMETKLRNQGLNPEDAAYKSQMAGIDTAETDAYGNLQSQAVTQGMGEQAQTWGQGLQAGNFYNQGNQQNFGQNLGANAQNFSQASAQSAQANQLRQQQMTEAMQQRGFSLNEINALMSGSQINAPQMPSFAQASQAEAAPIYQGAVDQGNADAANNPMSGLMGLAGTLGSAYMTGGTSLAASDRRLKRNIKRIGTMKGYPWYSYTYVWGAEGVGVMSDEVPSEFVVDIGAGYDGVDYGRLLAD
jgi:hypothetical protein